VASKTLKKRNKSSQTKQVIATLYFYSLDWRFGVKNRREIGEEGDFRSTK
jgi:hypothetical protein